MSLSHGFECEKEEFIEEINAVARHYRHRKTGAELLSLSGDDENKVFGASFRTPSDNGTGIAHIMEHSVLCGSRKYPVKAPFLQMLKSSLNTFLNAVTFPDKTVYPVASANLQDFYNLVDVYLDCVLHPQITPETLKQEGWHFELDSPDAPLIYKGVVYNEMKGNYSSPDDRVRRLSQQAIFPDAIYGNDSGGDPAEIPDLTYEDFSRFHETFYHPSNAKFFFYGDDDPEKRLEILDKVLSEFEHKTVDSTITPQPRFGAPRSVDYRLHASEPGVSAKQAQITVNWMFDRNGAAADQLGLTVLNQILLGTAASPLRKALIDSGLGDGLTGSGFGNWYIQSTFNTGLKGIHAGDAGKVEALILDTLGSLARDGIDPQTVEAAMNTTEFRLRENNTGAFPRGIALFYRALTTWNYDGSPFTLLRWHEAFDELKTRLNRGERVFEELIQSRLIDNPHRVTALFKPDPSLAAQERATERERLDAARAAMSDEDVQAVIEDARRLKALQEAPDSPDALATIPQLTLADLPETHAPIPITSGTVSGVRLLSHDIPANGIVYLDLGFDLRRLPADLLPYVGIFRRALLETGAGDMDMVALSQAIGRTTGGLSTNIWTSALVGNADPAAWLFLRSKLMPEKAGDLRALLETILFSARLDDHERLSRIVAEERSGMEARLIPGGHMFIGSRLRASLNKADWASEKMTGVSYLLALRDIANAADTDPGAVAAKLEHIRRLLMQKDAMILNVTADNESIGAMRGELEKLASAVLSGSATNESWSAADYPLNEGLTIPAKVNYVAKGADLGALGFPSNGAGVVASHWLRGSWLWEKVRVQGGAYGGFCVLDPISNAFHYASYRDPNLTDTLDVYDGAGRFLRDAAASDLDRERAIIGTVGKLDAYKLPDAKGMLSMQRYLSGASDSWLQAIRASVMTLSAADLREFADALDAVAEKGRVVVMGAEDTLKSAEPALSEPFTLTKLM